MKYQITSDNMQVTPSMEALAQEKLSRIEHRLKDVPEESRSARVVMNTAPVEKFAVKVQIDAAGREYFSNETDFTLESALIRTVEEILEMMEKEKHEHKVKDELKAEDLMEE